MKIFLLKLALLSVIFEIFYSCAKGGGGDTSSKNNDEPLSLSSFYSLDDLATSTKKLGKVPAYTTSGSENGLISMGDISACVVMSSGKIKCWGFNENFQLGSTTSALINQRTPVTVDILSDTAIAVSAGYRQTCAYLYSGMKCWGSQTKGILGNQVDSNLAAQTPQDVKTLGGNQIKMMATGDLHICVLFSGTQSVSCWGQNTIGQLALPFSTTFSLNANPISLPEPIKSIATSDYTACAVAVSGNLYCWGQDITTSSNPSPVMITSGVKNISSGEQSHFCYINTNDGVNCFGKNEKLQLGITPASSTFNKNPNAIPNLVDVNAIVVGKTHSCAISDNGASVFCWGDNSLGQLGNGSAAPAQSKTPLKVIGISPGNVIDIAASDNVTCVLHENDDIYCWGNNSPPTASAVSDFLGIPNPPTVSNTAVKILNRNDP